MTGAAIRTLMRAHHRTIAGLAAQWNITKVRVREVRANGVSGSLAVEWTYLITGVWT